MNAYLPILVQLGLAALIAAGVVAASQFLGQRRRKTTSVTDTPYECGVNGGHLSEQSNFNVKFFVIAMLFLVVDIEIVFLFPWIFIFRDFLANNLPVVAPMVFFLGVLVLGLLYEFKKGALEWEK